MSAGDSSGGFVVGLFCRLVAASIPWCSLACGHMTSVSAFIVTSLSSLRMYVKSLSALSYKDTCKMVFVDNPG